MGAQGNVIPSIARKKHNPSHIGLFPVWAMAQEAGLPVLFHVGGEEKVDLTYKVNGLPAVPDFHECKPLITYPNFHFVQHTGCAHHRRRVR